jgi:hypothetical protein
MHQELDVDPVQTMSDVELLPRHNDPSQPDCKLLVVDPEERAEVVVTCVLKFVVRAIDNIINTPLPRDRRSRRQQYTSK